jgi:formate dehydrogenase major subunit
VSWDEALSYAASEFRRIQAKHGRIPSAASPPRAAPTKKPTWCRSWCAPPSATTTSTPAPRLPLAHRLWPEADAGESAGTQTFESVMKADVILVIGANPTDGHPVFGSR